MEPTDTVFEMKEAIVSEKPSFKQIDADALRLWKVSEWDLRMLSNTEDLTLLAG
jgi:hypothetical protein